ncbi:hypothetical protein PF003_g14997 [Phytophthora fragariae]|nr:hypothetical protein PF003_g14997 [Phytophthora fragariae]
MRMKQLKREQTLENRLETSAVLIQAHSRGFLYRRRRWEEKQPTAVAAAVADTAPAAKVETPRDGDQWHEVRDVEGGEVWYYNATTGVSQWEPPPGQAFTPAATLQNRSLPELPALNTRGSLKARTNQQRSSSALESLPPLSLACSSARSTSRDQQEQQHQQSGACRSIEANAKKRSVRSPRGLPSLQPEGITSSPNPRECDSVLPSERSISSDQTQYAGGYAGSEAGDSFFERRRSLPLEFEDRDDDQLAPLASEDANSDWQTNDTLFRADGTKNNPRDATRKVRATESALMCANWLDQLRRKYRAEEIQEIFMKQRASLRYDRKLKQYVTVIECRHLIYRALEQLSSAWNKTMRRKLHTRSWFRSFLEQIRTDRLPRMLGGGGKETSRPPSLFNSKNPLQNARWVSKYSESVCRVHSSALDRPVQPKSASGLHDARAGDFMKNSNPDGALGLCSSVVYRSWAYMQNSPYDEFVTEDGVAYWYDRNTGDTFWTRPILPTAKFRGKDGEIRGVITAGEGEVATVGVGLGAGAAAADAAKDGGAARYSQQILRRYMTKKMETP